MCTTRQLLVGTLLLDLPVSLSSVFDIHYLYLFHIGVTMWSSRAAATCFSTVLVVYFYFPPTFRYFCCAFGVDQCLFSVVGGGGFLVFVLDS